MEKSNTSLVLSFTDEEVKEQVDKVLNYGRRTLEDSFRLGEMLISKKAEKEHGDWLPYLEKIGLSIDIAKNVMRAFKNKDNYVKGLSFSQFIGHQKRVINPISKEKKSDWFDQHCSSDIEALALRSMVKIQKKIEQDYGIVYINEFGDTIHQILELGITHLNYKEKWRQE